MKLVDIALYIKGIDDEGNERHFVRRTGGLWSEILDGKIQPMCIMPEFEAIYQATE